MNSTFPSCVAANVPTDWRPMDSAPRDATWVSARMEDGSVLAAHWAEGDGDGLIPPYRGWFVLCDGYYAQIPEPAAWRPLAP